MTSDQILHFVAEGRFEMTDEDLRALVTLALLVLCASVLAYLWLEGKR